jgi:hypothetical protein
MPAKLMYLPLAGSPTHVRLCGLNEANMTFIEAKNGRRYSANRIVSIGLSETRRGEGITEVELEGAGPVEFYTWRVEEFLRQPVSTFPAQPGTHILRLDEEDPSGFWKTLVIGWAVARDGRLYPVTAEGVNDCEEKEHFVLTPDGRVSQSDCGSYGTVEIWLKHCQNQSLAAE